VTMHAFRLWQWVLLAGISLLIIFIPLSTGNAAPSERTFYLDASRFQYSPAILKVNPGDTVTIVLSTTDVMHGLSIEGYNLETMAQPARQGTITFVADRNGVYRFHCTVVCGNMHPFMTGKLVVGQNTLLIRSFALLGLAMFAALWMIRR
jgi:heme/copper-type cytochrome/quinol oxidase subunit 2